jgi:hypothetical protein
MYENKFFKRDACNEVSCKISFFGAYKSTKELIDEKNKTHNK